MKKKIFIVLGVIVVIFGIIWLEAERREKEGGSLKFEPERNYIVKETKDEKIVENKRAGIIFKAPANWTVEKSTNREGEGYINVSSPDIEFFPQTQLAKNGCNWGISTEYRLWDIELLSLKDAINDVKQNPDVGVNKYKEIIRISSRDALKIKIPYKTGEGEWVEIQLPCEGEKTVVINGFFSAGQKERCSEEFNKFLENISITK